MKDYSDSEIIESVKNGDYEAFEKLLQKYGTKIYNLCYRLAGNENDAKDLAQTVFVQAFKAIKKFKQDSCFSTWLHSIAVNTWINIYKKRKKIRFLPIEKKIDTGDDIITQEMADTKENIEIEVEKKEEEIILQKYLMKLDPDQRIAVILKFVENKSYEEIAQICKCSKGTVGSRISRAMNNLRKCLKEIKGEKDEM